MPYRLKPSDKKVIQVQRSNGKWEDKYYHDTEREAKAQLYVLNKSNHK